MKMYSMTARDIEETADAVKVAVVSSLVASGLIQFDEGEEWAKNNTILLRTKNIFQTLSSLWRDTEETEEMMFVAVKKRWLI